MTADSILDLPIATAVVPSADDAGCGEPDVEARCGEHAASFPPTVTDRGFALRRLCVLANCTTKSRVKLVFQVTIRAPFWTSAACCQNV